MGGSTWSDDAYTKSVKMRSVSKGVSSFSYDRDIRVGTVSAKTHDKLNPKGVVRESRDSDAHPTSNAIAVVFDNTGSMGEVPRVLQTKLPKLMSVLAAKGAIEHPQVMFSCVGDVTSDVAPLQVGQFESGIEMDEDLDKMYLEGMGGGQQSESYEMAMYFMARKTSIDCLEKRGKKGYLFLIGDEMARDVDRRYVKSLIGDDLEQDIPLVEMVEELTKKYETYFIIPTSASYGNDAKIKNFWHKLFGQNVLKLEDANLVCELIAATIAIAEDCVEDVKDLAADLKLDKNATRALTTALADVKSKRSLKVKVEGELVSSGTNSIESL